MKSVNQLLSQIEALKKNLTLSKSPVNNNEVWSLQQQFQIICGQLLTEFQEKALECGIERDLWNIGFRATITELQGDIQSSKKIESEVSRVPDLLTWFLNAASGFYIQLLNKICSTNSLDLVFRRKDTFLGLNLCSQNSLVPRINSKNSSASKNALYLCQYCLVHLGDLARYKHQAKQAEAFYKQAVSVAPTCGQPYNQLALLEAGRGNKLSAVFLYIRSVCVQAPFPVAPTNLYQTLHKILLKRSQEDSPSADLQSGSLTRMTKEEYLNLFLLFHSTLLLKGDFEEAAQCLPRLASALSTLVATTTLTRNALVQMFCINVFTFDYFSGKIQLRMDESKKDETFFEPKESSNVLELLENLIIFMLAALLLPIHTMKDPEVVITYSALPAINLMLLWVYHEGKLNCPALKKKQQIWPGLCALLNFVQKVIYDFDVDQFATKPLPEDRDLQGFQPLSKIMGKYKYHDDSMNPSPEESGMLRASRLTTLSENFSSETLNGGQLIKMSKNESGLKVFEAAAQNTPPVEEVLDLERLTMQPLPQVEGGVNKRDKVGILKPQGSLERSKEGREKNKQTVNTKQAKHSNILKPSPEDVSKNVAIKAKPLQVKTEGRKTSDEKLKSSNGVIPMTNILTPDAATIGEGAAAGKRVRTNVALQAILKRKTNSQEAKQVTFKTPSPAISPGPSTLSNEGKGSRLSSPPLPDQLLNSIANNSSVSSAPPSLLTSQPGSSPLHLNMTQSHKNLMMPTYSNSENLIQNQTSNNAWRSPGLSHIQLPDTSLPPPPCLPENFHRGLRPMLNLGSQRSHIGVQNLEDHTKNSDPYSLGRPIQNLVNPMGPNLANPVNNLLRMQAVNRTSNQIVPPSAFKLPVSFPPNSQYSTITDHLNFPLKQMPPNAHRPNMANTNLFALSSFPEQPSSVSPISGVSIEGQTSSQQFQQPQKFVPRNFDSLPMPSEQPPVFAPAPDFIPQFKNSLNFSTDDTGNNISQSSSILFQPPGQSSKSMDSVNVSASQPHIGMSKDPTRMQFEPVYSQDSNLNTNIHTKVSMGINSPNQNIAQSGHQFFQPPPNYWSKDNANMLRGANSIRPGVNVPPPMSMMDVRNQTNLASANPPIPNIFQSQRMDQPMTREQSPQHRMNSTYSLFGPLVGSLGILEPQSALNRNIQPCDQMNTANIGQQSRQSLWSGPSPLERLLEQKKFQGAPK